MPLRFFSAASSLYRLSCVATGLVGSIKVLCREIARLATCPMVADSHTRLARAEPNRIIEYYNGQMQRPD